MIFVPKKRAEKAIQRRIEQNKRELREDLDELRKEYLNSKKNLN